MSLARMVVELLEKEPGLTQYEIQQKLNCDRESLPGTLTFLRRKKRIEATRVPRRISWGPSEVLAFSIRQTTSEA